MDFTQLKQVIRNILLSAPCPHCGEKMGIGKVEILNVHDKNFAFRTECERCGAEPIVQGNIRDSKNVFATRRKNSSALTPDSVKGLAQKLAAFRGKDVRELFKLR